MHGAGMHACIRASAGDASARRRHACYRCLGRVHTLAHAHICTYTQTHRGTIPPVPPAYNFTPRQAEGSGTADVGARAVTVPVAQAGFGSSEVYGYGDSGGANSMFDAATTSEAAALAAAKVPAVCF